MFIVTLVFGNFSMGRLNKVENYVKPKNFHYDMS